MLQKPKSRDDIVEQCHNEIIGIIVKNRLLASDIVMILELIKSDVIKQLNRRFYEPKISTKKPTSIQGSQKKTPIKGNIPVGEKKMPEVPQKIEPPSSPKDPRTN